MFLRIAFYLTLIGVLADGANVLSTRVARANFASGGISGTITFTETTTDSIRVTGTLTGLPLGNYGFHIHETGDISTCDATSSHFNPDDTNHGGRDHEERHVGDFGNIEFGTDAVATIDFEDSVISLRGRNTIVGRALVLHAEADDLGLGGNEQSLATGNAGARVSCAVIGIVSPVDPWWANSAASSAPSLILLAAAFILYFVQF